MGKTTVAVPQPAATWSPSAVDAKDIQGLVISGYGKLPYAAFFMLHQSGGGGGGRGSWINALLGDITGSDGKRSPSINLAFTAEGLRVLGLDDPVEDTPSPLASFSPQFVQGMTYADRARFLGDDGDQAPEYWRWHGGPAGGERLPVHAVLMLYTESRQQREAETARLLSLLQQHGVASLTGSTELEVYETEGVDRRSGETVVVRREHFGFADGLSQPVLRVGPSLPEALDWHGIPVGDVLFGHPNTYGEPAPGPLVDARRDPAGLLPDAAEAAGMRDLGRNGTYLVARQYVQDVASFWHALDREAPKFLNESRAPADAAWLAERCIGRTTEGDMLTPDGIRSRADPQDPDNDFGFLADDPDGFGCPVGSHVRRANPRDSLAPTPELASAALHSANRHRILRRGRPFGPPLPDKRVDDGVERGLYFVALNTDLARQFEFIQHMWLMNTNFGGLFEEADPTLGPPGAMTIPSAPVRQRARFERYVTVVGGEYFFLPSLTALRYLGTL